MVFALCKFRLYGQSQNVRQHLKWGPLKNYLAPVAITALLLAGCGSPAAPQSSPSTPTSTTSSAAPSPSATPTRTATAEPTTLREALSIANKDHADTVAALGAMEDLGRQAQIALKPAMTATEWGKIDIIRMNTGIGALSDKLTDREVILGVREYALAVEKEAIRQGKV